MSRPRDDAKLARVRALMAERDLDALSHLGVTHVEMPVNGEKVWRAIAGASA